MTFKTKKGEIVTPCGHMQYSSVKYAIGMISMKPCEIAELNGEAALSGLKCLTQRIKHILMMAIIVIH